MIESITKKKNALKTGHCVSGWHEGDNPDLGNGKSAPTCKHYIECPCECHSKYDEMFRDSDLPRILVDNSSYKVESTFWLPSVEERVVMRLKALKEREDILVQEPTTEHSVRVNIRTFSETPTGRLARGQLEQLVLLSVTRWVEASPVENSSVENSSAENSSAENSSTENNIDCTLNWIIANVEEVDTVTLVSPGAIRAVLLKWMEVGFAMVGGRPFQFYGFTPDGKRLGLDALRLRGRDTEKAKAREGAYRIPGKKRKEK